jgi:GTPase SAR1 family protein
LGRPASIRDVSAKENPFASSKIESLSFRFPAGMSWESLLKKLDELRWTASFVGGNGSGKTTLIEQLLPRLEERGFQPVVIRLSAETSMREKDRLPEKIRDVVAPQFLIIDGAEQLSTRHWLPVRGAASKAAGFIVTVHRSSRLPVALELETNVKLFEALVTELCGGKLPEDESHNIFLRHRGNIRDCFRELYDRWNG